MMLPPEHLDGLADGDEHALEYLFTQLVDAPATAVRYVAHILPSAPPAVRTELVAWLALVGAREHTSEIAAEAPAVLEALAALETTTSLAAFGSACESWGRLSTPRAHREAITARLRDALDSAESGEDRAALVSALGYFGADVSDLLGDPELAVAAAAARYNRSIAGTNTLMDVLADPDTEEAWAALGSSYCITSLVDELLRRGLSFAELEHIAVAYAADEYLPWQMFLSIGAGHWDTPSGRRFLDALVRNDAAWEDDSISDTAEALRAAGLPDTRDALAHATEG